MKDQNKALINVILMIRVIMIVLTLAAALATLTVQDRRHHKDISDGWIVKQISTGTKAHPDTDSSSGFWAPLC